MANVDKKECLINGVEYKCRTCFDPGRNIYPLTDEASNKKTWLDLLKDITKLQANDEEKLPKTLCCICSEKLKKAYEFILQIQDVNEKYSELLAKNDFLMHNDNLADCLAESAIALPLEQYVPEIKMEEEMVMAYDNKSGENNEDNFDNDDDDDPFTETFDTEKATDSMEEVKEEKERAIVTTEENATENQNDGIELLLLPLVTKITRSRKGKRAKGIKSVQMEKPKKVRKADKMKRTDKTRKTDKVKKAVRKKLPQKHTSENEVRKDIKVEKGKKSDKVQETRKEVKKKYKIQKPEKGKDEEINASGADGPIVCAHCPQSFFTLHEHQKHQFKEHPSNDSNDATNICPLCSKKLTNKFTVIYHIKVVHDKIKPYKCAHCTKTFGQLVAKNIHELSHTDYFPHQCEFCEKRFRALGKLTQHMEVHTTKPELLCHICKRGQKSQEDLEAHMRNHRLQCPTCGKLFIRKPNLDDHYNSVHLKLKPFKCRFCDHWFVKREHRRTHEKKYHGVVGNAPRFKQISINLPVNKT